MWLIIAVSQSQRTFSALLLHILAVLNIAALSRLNDGVVVARGIGLCGNYIWSVSHRSSSECIRPLMITEWSR